MTRGRRSCGAISAASSNGCSPCSRRVRREMKGLPWGLFYNEHHERRDLDPKALEERVSALMADEDVQKKSGVYEYLLTGNEKALSIPRVRPAYEARGIRAPGSQVCHLWRGVRVRADARRPYQAVEPRRTHDTR